MQYKSTRDSKIRLEASQVIAQGISAEGGLFVPETLPSVQDKLPQLLKMGYRQLAEEIFTLFLTDFSRDQIADCVKMAYTEEKFGASPVKVVGLSASVGNPYLLELWHGPTCAFKDMALQILPHFLTESLKKSVPGKEAVILVATSGDTGKAALEGFRDVRGTKVIVFYPQDGVSPMQKRQMATQEGGNVSVCAINGNFDDAQTAVKKIFTDKKMDRALAEHNFLFSSANSINWGRLLPQIVYYFYAYFQLCRDGRISLGESINVAVPTGNFGNILAAYYAREMGLPIQRFICASNSNKVLADFIATGIYDRRREFFATSSPSMDILISSNLERLLYALSGENSEVLSVWMESLAQEGHYDVGDMVRKKVQTLFFGGFCNDEDTTKTIAEVWKRENYLCDTHTAVAVNVYAQYVQKTGDSATPTIIASTASPYKFVKDVLGALEPVAAQDEFMNIARLETLTGTSAPSQLKELEDKPVRFHTVLEKNQSAKYILETLGIDEG
ncbi:threonine synthase [Acutalibacter sp. 1XD8-33]|uniref:threonine synthase n=1 Tax=Acutalibacter sp. 1XD8-33 TaxID=2320081 RepID=UPI0018F4A7D4|nr:threonine synthase [Acutalibacter sp. 1XD8-33]